MEQENQMEGTGSLTGMSTSRLADAMRSEADTTVVSPVAAASVSFDDLDFDTRDGMQITMKSLFGPHFHVDVLDFPAALDPALIDTRTILRDLFGQAVGEDDVSLFVEDRHSADALMKEMKSNKDVLVFEEGARYFGAAGAQVVTEDNLVPFTLLESSLPAGLSNSAEADASTPNWLLDMPVIYPNRQTLHADPRPCDFSADCYLESNKFMLYTPSNVLRWTVDDKGQPSSNCRMVRWSDGSITMHVGNDVHSLLPSQDPSLNLLGHPVRVGKSGMEIDSMLAAKHPETHLNVRIGGAASIEAALAMERRQSEQQNKSKNLPFADATMPSIDWLRPQKGRSIQEEFVRSEYEAREKEMKRRLREGRPVTLAEQLQMEADLRDHVNSATADELMAEREDALRQATLKSSQSTRERERGRSRLDRDVGLDGGDGRYQLQHSQNQGDDPFLDDEEVSSNEEESSANDAESDADSFERQMADMYVRNQAAKDGLEETAESQRRKRSRDPDDGIHQYNRLIGALNRLVQQIPMDADAYASVDGTRTFLQADSPPVDMVLVEVPKMLAEVEKEFPDVSTQEIRNELLTLK